MNEIVDRHYGDKTKPCVLYSVFERNNMALSTNNDLELGACITEAYDCDEAISDAEDYYMQKMIDDGEYGEGDCDAILVRYDERTDIETLEKITLSWSAEKDDYDGGRFDYYSSRGVK